jgi:hypothetical protein
LLIFGAQPALAASPIDLLNAANVHIDGQQAGDQAGIWVQGAGDVNGDGIDDLLVCAITADQNGRANSGSGYVIYGRRHLGNIDLQTLGQRGFRIDGAAAGDSACWSGGGVGDVNGDGIDDVAIGAPEADNNGRSNSGSAYVIYGQNTPDPSDVDLANITTTQASRGFRIDGALASDQFATTVGPPIGDFNHDGIDDMVIGGQLVNNNGRAQSGSSYVIYGQPNADPADIDLANITTTQATRGMRIDGAAAGDNSGWYFGAGDVNGDGIPDLAISNPLADDNGRGTSGSVAVVYGQNAADPTDVDLANITGSQATRGMLIDGGAALDQAGYSTTIGDFNGDGISDVAVGSATSDHNGRTDSGSEDVVYGQNTPDPTDVDLSGITAGDASRGMEIDGAAAGDEAGFSSSAGDVNGDGIDDIVIGAPGADNNGRGASGSVYVAYGQQSADPTDIDFANITGSQGSRGLRTDGAAAGDEAGFSSAFAGDVNGDGFGDVAVGAVLADNNGRTTSGSVYIPAIPPANDDFANAASLSGSSGSATDGSGFASKESGEPDHAGDPGGASVWWNWTAPADGLATVDTCHSDFDTVLGVYTGSAVNSLSEVASDDDGCGAPAGPSKVSFQATQGTTYRIAVDGHDAAGVPATGHVALHLKLTDDVPPTVSIVSGPKYGSFTKDSTPTFTFTADEPATFKCRYEGFSFASCSGGTSDTPAAPLSNGLHTFYVRPTDAAGNRGDPLDIQFTVDTVPPTITISGPSTVTTTGTKASATFSIAVSETVAKRCRVDTRPFTACGSVFTTPQLPLGNHSFTVKATDRAQNVATKTKTFKIVKG